MVYDLSWIFIYRHGDLIWFLTQVGKLPRWQRMCNLNVVSVICLSGHNFKLKTKLLVSVGIRNRKVGTSTDGSILFMRTRLQFKQAKPFLNIKTNKKGKHSKSQSKNIYERVNTLWWILTENWTSESTMLFHRILSNKDQMLKLNSLSGKNR
jgi:hypothetical protein